MSGSRSNLSEGAIIKQIQLQQVVLINIVNDNENLLCSSMPNYKNAITPDEKFLNYSLDYTNPNSKGKAEAYERSLGYNKENARDLIDQIHTYITSGNPPYEVTQTEYGTKYKFRIPITGPNGNTKNVIAVYQIDSGETTPRLITNYVEAKK